MSIQRIIHQPVTSRERKLVYGFIMTFVLLMIVIGAYGSYPLKKVPIFASLTSVIIMVTAFQTSFLLYYQSKLESSNQLTILACGYSISSLFALAYVIFYPGFFFSFTDTQFYNESVAWLSLFGHAHFSLAIILYGLNYAKIINFKSITPEILFPCSFIYGVTVILWITFGHGLFINIIQGDSYYFNASVIIALSLIILAILAAFSVLNFTDLSSRHNLWLLLATVLHILEITYGVFGHTRFSLGWYAARTIQVCSFSIILGIFTYHLTLLMKNLQEVNQQLEELATMDFLTKISNRRKFIITLDNYWSLAQREHKSVCLIMIDIDHFKFYNDTFGHLAGDECLIRVAQELKRIFKRHNDIVSRIGGEEFAVLLYNVGEKEGNKIAEKIRRSVENLHLQTYSTKQPHITVSIGCASINPGKYIDPTYIIDVADQALYEAKFKGRNRVILASQSYTLHG